MKAVYFGDGRHIGTVYGEETREKLRALYKIPDRVYQKADLSLLSDTEYFFTTWGMPSLTEEEIRTYLPKLKAVFYAAGSVQSFAKPFLSCGVRVFSAWQANAVPVCEFAVSEILLAAKGFFRTLAATKRSVREGKDVFHQYPGNYRAKIGILGDGAIGSRVIAELLRHDLDVYVFSITMSEKEAKEKGVRLASLSEIFRECDVISNHLANNPQTVGIIGRDLLFSMKPRATLINTGRGAQIREDALIEKLTEDPGVSAVLDVTDPEPPAEDSPLFLLPNVFLTPHMAGSSGNELQRMAAYMAEECVRFDAGEECPYEVTSKMLETMA